MQVMITSMTNLNMSFVNITRIGKLSLFANSLTKDDILLKQEHLQLLALRIRACRFFTADEWSMKEQVPLCSYLTLRATIISLTIKSSFQSRQWTLTFTDKALNYCNSMKVIQLVKSCHVRMIKYYPFFLSILLTYLLHGAESFLRS